MAKYQGFEQKCKKCGHIWYLISDETIDTYQYIAWMIDISAEHSIIHEEKNDENETL